MSELFDQVIEAASVEVPDHLGRDSDTARAAVAAARLVLSSVEAQLRQFADDASRTGKPASFILDVADWCAVQREGDD